MNKRKTLEGVVVSNKMKKTIVVTVTRKFSHSLYKKLITKRKKFKVHDEENKAKIQDRVRIVECRPISKEKHFKLLEILSTQKV